MTGSAWGEKTPTTYCLATLTYCGIPSHSFSAMTQRGLNTNWAWVHLWQSGLAQIQASLWYRFSPMPNLLKLYPFNSKPARVRNDRRKSLLFDGCLETYKVRQRPLADFQRTAHDFMKQLPQLTPTGVPAGSLKKRGRDWLWRTSAQFTLQRWSLQSSPDALWLCSKGEILHYCYLCHKLYVNGVLWSPGY